MINQVEYSPNVKMIRNEGIRIVRGTIFRQVRTELMNGVKIGALGRLKKDDLKPEIFYHPDREQDAIELQINEALYAIDCLKRVFVSSNELE